tara:strand:+ start:122 stop:307 length:186 start_codon:yes stop_codon:yes gene_type:complete
MKKVKVIELVNTTTNEMLGYAPIIEEKGCKPKMIIEDDEPLKFETRKEAKAYGLAHIKPKN